MSFFDPLSPDNKKIVDYFKDKSCLIIDPLGMNRTTIKKILMTLGFVHTNINGIDDAIKASDIFFKEKPNFVFTNLELNEFSGLDFLDAHLSMYPNRLEAGFVVISGDNSISNAAISLDYEIDGFIPVPFTIQGFQNTVLRAVKTKINPSPYITMLEKGKGYFYQEDFENAKKVFIKAQELEEKPVMARFYESACHFFAENYEDCEKGINDALKMNSKFYKGLNGLYRIYELLDNNEKAYDVTVKMAELFPINVEKFPNLTRLCIKTKKYQDVLKFYDIIKTAKVDCGRVKTYVSAGLVIVGKVSLSLGDKAQAIDSLKKAGIIANNKIEILRNVFQMLLAEGEIASAEMILKHAKEDNINDLHYQLLNFKILAKRDGPAKTLVEGKKLILSELKDLEIYLDLISALKGQDEFREELDKVVASAKKDYPLDKIQIEKAQGL